MARYYIEEDPENPGHMTKKLICGSFLDASPIGTIHDYAGSGVPAGWLACNGQAVSRSEYQFLFNVIGTTYGPGDGSTTFNVPNEGSGYDLTNPENITIEQLYAGYTAQHSGWFIFSGYNSSTTENYTFFSINGVNIAGFHRIDANTGRIGYVQIPVKKGDVIKSATNTLILFPSNACFIAPYAKPRIIKAKLEANAGDIGLKTGVPEVPDYAHQKTITGNTWTADEDVWVSYTNSYASGGTPYPLYADGVEISSATTNSRTHSFAGRIAKGTVLSANGLNSSNFRAWPFK